MSNEIGTILSIIPQSYYDFIAKLIPGFSALEISSYIFFETLKFPNNIWEIILGFTSIYIIGIVLDIGGLYLFSLFEKLKKINHKSKCKYQKNNKKDNSDDDVIAVRDIHIKLHQITNSQDANIIVKMLAETVLLRSFSLFFILVPFVKLFEIILCPKAELIACLRYIGLSILAALIFHALRVTLQKETDVRAKSMLNST